MRREGIYKTLLTECNNMSTDSYEILMPEKARVMTEEEMEYEGGILNFLVAAVATVASVGCSVMANATGNSAWKAASVACGVVSAVCSFGVGTAFNIAVTGSKSIVTRVASKAISKSAAKTIIKKSGYEATNAGYAVYSVASKVSTVATTPMTANNYYYNYLR